MAVAQKLTPEEALAELEALEGFDDWESAHSKADGVLCSLLNFHGHEDVVCAFEKIGKWYA